MDHWQTKLMEKATTLDNVETQLHVLESENEKLD